LKDFNIANEAGGVGKNLKRKFSTTVSNKSLEIRFYWAGKGTTAIPEKSVYGPLISAISVTRGELLCLYHFVLSILHLRHQMACIALPQL